MPWNDACPLCDAKINRIRNVPRYDGRRYCSSDCAIDAWQDDNDRREVLRMEAERVATTFGKRKR